LLCKIFSTQELTAATKTLYYKAKLSSLNLKINLSTYHSSNSLKNYSVHQKYCWFLYKSK